jgi:ABC-type branched-subunit amino acid transport system ATPase component/ABC-type branched-subunit amino acid transport system permease subunit
MRYVLPIAAIVVLLGALALPFMPLSKYELHVANLIIIAAILAMSLDLLFGYLGQMTLAHAGFYGLGAYTAGLLTVNGILPFWLATPAAMGLSAAVGGLLGWPAMRLTGFYLAMATMSFGIILSSLFVQSVGLTGGPNGLLGIEPPQFFGTELIGPVRGLHGNYYYLLLASGLATWLLLRRVTTGRLGRMIQGVRDSTLAAASIGIDVRRVQVAVFALSCALAGLAGSLYAHLILYISPESFTFTNSLLALLGVVFGGIGTLWGPVLGAGLLTVLGEVLHAFGAYELMVYAAAICAVILLVPHGISGLLLAAVRPRQKPAPASDSVALPTSAVQKPAVGGALLELDGLSKRFGGVQALDAVSFSVAENEIKALIGPNGSGKTTLFNCITGVIGPDGGQLRFAGSSITGLPAHRIARTGLSRSFQVVQLFGRMTVLENVLLAGQRRHPCRGLSAVLGLPAARRADAANAAAAERLLAEAGLSAWRDQPAANLPYGRQRLLEIARALATKPRLLMLDEPAAGLNTAEAFELGDYLRRVQATGVTILLVEHNMPFVLDLADSIAVLDQGRKIADGKPAAIQSDAAVIAAYLGAPAMEAA